MNTRIKKSVAILVTAIMVLATAFQSLAAPLSYTKPAAEAGTEKVTGTWSKDAAGNWHFSSNDGTITKDGWYYLNTTNKATEYNWFCFDANGVMRTGWIPDKNASGVWYYTGESKDSSEGGLMKGWITDPHEGKKYYLDPATGIMCHGWQKIDNVWYYFGERQDADRGWSPNASGNWRAATTGKHSYGSLYINEYTPDGYYVGSNGAWIQGGGSSSGSSYTPPTPVTTYTVRFNMQGHGTQINPITGVTSGLKITSPSPAPTADGFTFGGWYKEVACTNAWNFGSDTVTTNITLYAKWTPTVVSVTGVSIDPIATTLQVGEICTLTATVTPDNASDKNVTWSSNNTAVATVSDAGIVTAITVGEATITVTTIDGNKTATCTVEVTPITYTVSFDLNGATGTAPEDKIIESGGKVTKPTDPPFEEHTLAGWYKKDATTGRLSDEWNFDTNTVTEDITLYAQWKRKLESIRDSNETVPKVNNNIPPANAWVNGNDSKAFFGIDDKHYRLIVKNDSKKYGLGTGAEFIKVNEYYEYEDSNYGIKITCNMVDGKFVSFKLEIPITGYELLNGTYQAPASTLTVRRPQSIGSIIGDSLPTIASPDDAIYDAWKSDKSAWCYIFSDEENADEKFLVFDDLDDSISINLKKNATKVQTEVALEGEEIYKHESKDYIIYFNMIDGYLDSIEFESKGEATSPYEGIYRASEVISEEIETEGTKEDVKSDDSKAIQDEETEKKNAEPESEISEIAAEVKKEEQSQPLDSKEKTDQETE